MMWTPASGNRTLNGTTLNNVTTALNYIVNGTLITADNQTVTYNSTTLRIRYLNEFDSIYMDPSWVLNLTQPVGGNWTYMANTSLILKPYTHITTDPVSNASVTLVRYTGFNSTQYKNPLLQFYYNGYLKELTFNQRISGLGSYFFDSTGMNLYLPMNDASISQNIWLSNTRSVAFMDNGNASNNASYPFKHMWCTGQNYWDTLL